jgi:hypothetical protein
MPRAGFEPTIPVFEQVDTFYALDHAATEIDIWAQYLLEVINSVA